jgi:hypothetical protein
LISRQEYEAWEVLLACQGQLRLAPSGHVIGIDMMTALRLGAARGCDRAVLSELLPAAEAGLLEASSGDRGRAIDLCQSADVAWTNDRGLATTLAADATRMRSPCRAGATCTDCHKDIRSGIKPHDPL